jgi:hypothetical protein
VCVVNAREIFIFPPFVDVSHQQQQTVKQVAILVDAASNTSEHTIGVNKRRNKT